MNQVICKTPSSYNHRHISKRAIPVRHNIVEGEKNFVIEFAIPGFTKEDFEIESTRTALKISFKNPTEKKEKIQVIDRGFYYHSFERTFKLNPQRLDFEGIKAAYQSGILRIEVPKTAAAIQTSRSIEVH